MYQIGVTRPLSRYSISDGAFPALTSPWVEDSHAEGRRARSARAGGRGIDRVADGSAAARTGRVRGPPAALRRRVGAEEGAGGRARGRAGAPGLARAHGRVAGRGPQGADEPGG